MQAIDRQGKCESPRPRTPGPSRTSPLRRTGNSTVITNRLDVTQIELIAERQAFVLSVIAELLGAVDLERSLDAFTGALQQGFGVERVALGLVDSNESVSLHAISQQAQIDTASNEARLLINVMQECLEHEDIVCFPNDDIELGVLVAHRELVSRDEGLCLASVPLYQDSEPVGVLLFERHEQTPFAEDVLELLEQIALLAAAPLKLRQMAERSLPGRAKDILSAGINRRFGAGKDGARLVLVLACAAVFLGLLVPVQERVTAKAELVPIERRLITAPFDGFVDEVVVKLGDSVEVDQVLARLERRELELEGTRRDGELASAEADFRAAMASYDRQATAVARARLERERASRALIDQRLGRVELRAPISGLVISGNPTDAVGAPIARGDALLEIARAEGYEVHLMVHERDIRELSEGQRGTLRLRSRPGDALALVVHAIHPVAESIDGASRFRVRANLEVPPGASPRPGESGIARMDTGRTNVFNLIARPVAQRLAELWWRISI